MATLDVASGLAAEDASGDADPSVELDESGGGRRVVIFCPAKSELDGSGVLCELVLKDTPKSPVFRQCECSDPNAR